MSFTTPSFRLPQTRDGHIRGLHRDLNALKRRSPVGPRIYIGTDGVDGVGTDAADGINRLKANPYPYRPGDTPGPPPFLNGVTNAFLLDLNGNPGDGLWYRWVGHGIQVDYGGGITPPDDNTIFATLFGVPFPTSSKPAIDGFLDGSGGFKWQLLAPGSGGAGTADLVYLGALVA